MSLLDTQKDKIDDDKVTHHRCFVVGLGKLFCGEPSVIQFSQHVAKAAVVFPERLYRSTSEFHVTLNISLWCAIKAVEMTKLRQREPDNPVTQQHQVGIDKDSTMDLRKLFVYYTKKGVVDTFDAEPLPNARIFT